MPVSVVPDKADGAWVAFDVGGTFIDTLSFDPRRGRFHATKHRSARHDAAESVRKALHAHLPAAGLGPAAVQRLAHGTTLVTNLLVERAGARVGLITTRGCRDVLEIGRMRRPSLYDLNRDKPAPLAPRAARLEVTERMGPGGEVLVALDEAELEAAAHTLRVLGVETVAVCFLHSYANSRHEMRAGEILAASGFAVSLSSKVSAEYGEFERFSAAVINSYVMPPVRAYFDTLGHRIDSLGVRAPLQIMQSNGGVTTCEGAARYPVRLAASGPAAGVMGAAIVAGQAGFEQLITLDMGGTSTDVGLVVDTEPAYASEYEVDGFPVRAVGIDVHSIGAGGGSLARLDRTGALRVGPESAGGDPGPAGYGWGGEAATVADADLVLGYLNPERFCGSMRLYPALAEQAIQTHLAAPRGVSVDEAALGILQVAITNMVGAVRNITMERGRDPRDFVLVAFGGAGPIHACLVAAELHIPTVVIPREPGLLSAKGLLLTHYRADVYRTYPRLLTEVDYETLGSLFSELEDEARRELEHGSADAGRIRFRHVLELCYQGQQNAVPIELERVPVDAGYLERIAATLDRKFEQRFGFLPASRRPQILHVRVFAERGFGLEALLAPDGVPSGDGGALKGSVDGRRDVLLPGLGTRITVPVYQREALAPGVRVEGPAIVEESYSGTLIPPDLVCCVDPVGNLIIQQAGAPL